MSLIEDRVIQQINDRAETGKAKYGTTMDRNDLSLTEWLQHLQEELMDATIYIEKLKQEVQYQEFNLEDFHDARGWAPMSFDEDGSQYIIDGEAHPDPRVNFNSPESVTRTGISPLESELEDLAEIERERRMDLIGRNGNDGLHYAEEMIAKSDAIKLTRSVYPGDVYVTTQS